MKTLIELYTSILSSVGMTVDGEGFVSSVLPGSDQPKPFSVEGKRLVLPMENQLKMTDWSNRIGFHPFQQSLAGGESRVVDKFRDRMNGYADFSLAMLLIDLAQLGVKKDLHKEMAPAQANYLGPFSDSDEKFVHLLRDILKTPRMKRKNFEFIRFSLIKGRAWQGQKRSRVAVAHFPLYESLPKENKSAVINGFKFRVADVKMVRTMYEFLFPGIKEPGRYEVGSDSKIAPSMEAMMALYAKFTDVINGAVGILESVITTSNALLIVNDWREDMQNMEHYLPEIRKIPMLEGNAPSERVAQPNAPQRISETPVQAATKMVVPQDTTPTLPAHIKLGEPMTQSTNQGAQPVHNQEPAIRPRIKLGTKAPLIEHATHQISDAVAGTVGGSANTGYSYARPSALPATPPVGAILQEQQAAAPTRFGQPVQPQFNAPVQPQAPQAMKVPDTARLINGALYIPVEGTGVSGVPQGAVLVDGRVYMPLQAVTGAAGAAGTSVLPGQGFGAGGARFGMQQQITDPSQIPGLSQQEIDYFRGNPVMFQNYLSQQFAASTQAAQNVLMQRQTQVPRYLQRAAQEAQQQSQFTGGFLRR